MLKLNKVGERLFTSIDNFFRGQARISPDVSNGHLCAVNVLDTNYIEWELNQDIFDIAFCDIKSSFSWIIPDFIKELAGRVKRLGLLYLNNDVAEEEISGQWIKLKETGTNTLEIAKTKVISYPKVISDITVSMCLSISDKLICKINKFRLFINQELARKPYYLLGNFAPYVYDIPGTQTNRLIKEYDWFKLNPAFAFHKRI